MRTFAYVALSLAGCLLIGYPVAYYLARHARRTKGLLLVLLVVPFWVSYLMRMLAWIGLLLPDGARRHRHQQRTVRPRRDLRPEQLARRAGVAVILALIYGYIPYFILPLYAALDRIDRSHLEAAVTSVRARSGPSGTSRCR